MNRVNPSVVAIIAMLMLGVGIIGFNAQRADAHVIPPSTGVDLICPAPAQPDQGIQLQINTQKFPSSPSTLAVTASAKGLSDVSTIVENISASNPSGKLKNAIPAEFGLGDGFSVHITWTADGGGKADFGPFKCINQPVPTPTVSTPAPQPVTPAPAPVPTPTPKKIKKHKKPSAPTPNISVRKRFSDHRVHPGQRWNVNFVVTNHSSYPFVGMLVDNIPTRLMVDVDGGKVFQKNVRLAPHGSMTFHFRATTTPAALFKWVCNKVFVRVTGSNGKLGPIVARDKACLYDPPESD